MVYQLAKPHLIALRICDANGGKLSSLLALGLQHNAIGPVGALALAAALPHLGKLKELLLYSNKLGGNLNRAVAAYSKNSVLGPRGKVGHLFYVHKVATAFSSHYHLMPRRHTSHILCDQCVMM